MIFWIFWGTTVKPLDSFKSSLLLKSCLQGTQTLQSTKVIKTKQRNLALLRQSNAEKHKRSNLEEVDEMFVFKRKCPNTLNESREC
jgi:hypothetical protein